MTGAKDTAARPDNEHEHVPKKDSWITIRSGLPADLMVPAHYPVSATCQDCHLPIYADYFAAPWLLREAYTALYGEPDTAPGAAHGT